MMMERRSRFSFTAYRRVLTAAVMGLGMIRFRVKREQLKRFSGLLAESQGQNLASTCLMCAVFA